MPPFQNLYLRSNTYTRSISSFSSPSPTPWHPRTPSRPIPSPLFSPGGTPRKDLSHLWRRLMRGLTAWGPLCVSSSKETWDYFQ